MKGPYDYLKTYTDNYGMYQNQGQKNLELESGLFQIFITAAVYISGTCFLVSMIMLIFGSRGEKLKEGKGFFVKTLVVSLFIFSLTGGIDLLQKIMPG